MTKAVTRYTDGGPDGWMESPTGEFVRHEDYALIAEERDRLKQAIENHQHMVRMAVGDDTTNAWDTILMKCRAFEPLIDEIAQLRARRQGGAAEPAREHPTTDPATAYTAEPGPGTLEEIFGAGRSSGGLGDYK